MNANSAYAAFSGIVAYTDGSKGMFHCQGETNFSTELVWTVSQDDSKAALADLYADTTYRAVITAMISGDPEATTTWTSYSAYATGKTIADAVFHLDAMISWDDGTNTPASMTYGRGTLTTNVLGTVSSTPGNVTSIDSFIADVLDQVMHATVT